MNFIVSLKLALFVSLFSLLLMPSRTCEAAPSRKVKRAQVGQEFKLKVGEQVQIKEAGLRITFSRVAEDSRCPQGVTCIWAGNGRVILKASRGAGRGRDVQLNTGIEPKHGRVGEYEVRLVNLSPYPREGARIKRDEYVATLLVVKSGSLPTTSASSPE
jgi:uncharacterized protein YodC (DUF2158 family)